MEELGRGISFIFCSDLFGLSIQPTESTGCSKALATFIIPRWHSFNLYAIRFFFCANVNGNALGDVFPIRQK